MKNHIHIYIASCTPDGGIYHYLCQNGSLQLMEKTNVDRPMYLAVAENRLYAVLRQPFADSEHSGVCWWKIGKDGALTEPSEVFSTGGRCGCHLTVEQGKIYVANYLSGSVVMLPEGKLVEHNGKGPNPARQEAAHTHFVGMTPDQQYLLAVDLGTDTIYVYTPKLILQDRVAMVAGHGCRHLAWSEDGKYAFCVNELSSTVSVLQYEQGKLTLLDTVSALPGDFEGENTAAAIRVAGDMVYVSNRGCDNIAIFTHQEGVLSRPVFVDAEGVSPRDFYVHGDLLLCANEGSDCVSVFDCRKGQIHSQKLQLQISKPLCIVVKSEE